MKKIYLMMALLPSLICSSDISGQVAMLSPSVISSSGGFYTAGLNTFSVTVAEMTMVETFYNSRWLTQGFQQPLPDTITDFIIEAGGSGMDMSLFPNPASTQLHISFGTEFSSGIRFLIYDMIGQKVMSFRIDKLSAKKSETFDISRLAAGMYLITVLTDDKSYSESAPFIKEQ